MYLDLNKIGKRYSPSFPLRIKMSGSIPPICFYSSYDVLNHRSLSYPVPDKIRFAKRTKGALFGYPPA